MINPINSLVDYMFIPFLTYTYSVIPNYGIGIIVLTILIKILFYPLTQKQFKSMKMNQVLQPEVKKLQEKHKDDPKLLQQEMMNLWKSNGVNPLSGCLPMLIQLPFFFAIYATINSGTFKQLLTLPHINPGFLPFWLTNLGHPDPFYILPIGIGVLTWWSQKMFITDPKQASLFMFMPVVMTFICFNMPSGVLLYWFVSQLISSAQQFLMMREPQVEGVQVV